MTNTNSTNIKSAIAAATNLEELLVALNSYDDDISIDQSEADLPGLPNFGGDEPENTDGVWSWDAENLLINDGNDGFTIESRADYYA